MIAIMSFAIEMMSFMIAIMSFAIAMQKRIATPWDSIRLLPCPHSLTFPPRKLVLLTSRKGLHSFAEGIFPRESSGKELKMGKYGTAATVAVSVVAGFWSLETRALASYQGVAVVAKSGGQYTDPVDAMNKIQEWCPPSSTGKAPRCLLKIMPGIYFLGSNPLKMREYVDIEGAGEKTTLLSGRAALGTADRSPLTTGLVMGANNAELRFLGISATNEAAVFNSNASPLLTHLAISATNEDPLGFVYGIYNTASSPRITDVGVNATNGGHCVGIYNTASSAPRMQHVRISAKRGMGNNGVYNNDSAPEMIEMSITASEGEGCNGVINVNSPAKMEGVYAAARNCAYGTTGISNHASSPVMNNITASAEGSNYCIGISNESSSNPVMTNVTATAGECYDTNTGISNHSSSAVLSDVKAIVTGGGGAGLTCTSKPGETFKIFIDRSTFSGARYSIVSDEGVSLQIGASKLTGVDRHLKITSIV